MEMNPQFGKGMHTRSSTPPLLYRRSEPLIQQNSNTLRTTGRDLQAVQISTPVGARPGAHIPSKSLNPYAGNVSYVSNPFSSTLGCRSSIDRHQQPELLSSASLDRATTLSEGSSWPHSLAYGRDSDRLVSLDSEDAALLSEEAALKARLSELRAERQLCDDEQLEISQGWATLFDREQRFHTELVPDFSLDIVACEQRCLALQEQLQHAQNHLENIREQLKHYEPLLKEKENLKKEIKSMSNSFSDLENRRRNCLFRAGKFFDVESRRTIEAQRAVRVLDEELRELRNTHSSLAHETVERSMERTKKVVTRKSVNFVELPETILEKRHESLEEEQGMSFSSVDVSDNATTNYGLQETGQEFIGSGSICIGWGEDDNNDLNITGINGSSTVISLNQFDSRGPIAKRQKLEA